MKASISLAFIFFFLLVGSEAFSQRAVVKTPRKTVVTGPRGTVIYKKKPVVVAPVKRISRHAVVVHYQTRPYYYHSGVFYVSRSGAYVQVVPPVGIRVAVLPPKYVRVVVGPSVYFYATGVFYVKDVSSANYIVAKPPVGVVVATIPKEAAEVEFQGALCYEYNDVLYKPVPEDKSYQVVGEL
ncbi:hypothetical protein GM418_13445 [Maribellus comscasis]|uniref:Uncharacterized protein n=1 Tax=Maribellus comscasis TaxID=2681766 RepID=A0A6I6JQE3_9BACT|nr:DUF6515 family protein [Maribellus comscasis]QGY44631.1 hypothetical protein GM418_13445 [Maribellus comscasis]